MANQENKRIKVGMVISTYYPVWGGIQRQLIQLCEYLKPSVDLFILTRRTPGTKDEEIINGVPVYRVFVTNKFIFLDSLLFTSLSLLWLLRNKNKFNILHCYQMYSPTTIAILAKKIFKRTKVIVKITASNEYGETREIKRLPFFSLRMRLLKCVDKFLVLNRHMVIELNSLGIPSSHIEYLPNGVEIPAESSYEVMIKKKHRNRLNLSFKKIAVYTGRLSEEKCLDTLLLAWHKVCALYPDIHLIILGEGGRERNIEDKINKLRLSLKLEENVSLLGKVDNIFEYLLASDLFILPSISEGLSNSLLEAMAAGTGIIAGDNEGNRQLIVNGENGILVEPRNIEELYLAILGLIKNEDYNKQLGRNAKETVLKQFSLKNIAGRHIELYRGLAIKN